MREHRRQSLPSLLAALGVLVLPAGAWARLPSSSTHGAGQNPLRDVLRFLGTPEPARHQRIARLIPRRDRRERLAARRPRDVVPADLAEEDGDTYPGYGVYGGTRVVVIYPGSPYGNAPPYAYYGRPYAYRPYGPYYCSPYGR